MIGGAQMPLPFWLDVGAYVAAALLALTLTLFAVGSRPGQRLGHLFSLYTVSTAAYTLLAAMLRVALWLKQGDPELIAQLATWAFTLIGPALLLFAAHYVNLSTRWVTLAAVIGLVWCCVFVLPVVLQGQLVRDHYLGPNGTTHMSFTTLGVLSSTVPITYLVWALALFWLSRRRTGGGYMALSTVAMLVGVVGGALLDVEVPLLSFASVISLAILGYGVLVLQLFNPLRERNAALQQEIAERRRAEGEILRLQHLLQAIANSMPSALITLDLEGRVLTWNPAAERLIGLRADAVLGQMCWEVCTDLERYRDLVQTVIATRVPARRNRDPVGTRGHARYLDVEAFPLVSNGVTGAVLRIEDISRRVHFESLTLQTAKMVSVGRLAAGLAHELNNPLGAIMQGVQMITVMLDGEREGVRVRMEDAGVDSNALARYLRSRGMADYLDGIQVAGARAAGIVTDLLEFSQRSEFDLRPHDFNALLRTSVDLAAADYDLRKQYDFRDIEVIWDLAEDLPMVCCDAPQVQQVVLNLVQNAAQAMASMLAGGAGLGAGYQPWLVIRTWRTGQSVRLSITDNGPGIDPAIVDRLFEPFVTTRTVGEGTGLGLWLCWSIVAEHHGGRIWVESPEGGGARFVVELPIEGP